MMGMKRCILILLGCLTLTTPALAGPRAGACVTVLGAPGQLSPSGDCVPSPRIGLPTLTPAAVTLRVDRAASVPVVARRVYGPVDDEAPSPALWSAELARAMVRRALFRARPVWLSCYTDWIALRAHPAPLTVPFSLVVGESGLLRLTLRPSSPLDDSLSRCLVRGGASVSLLVPAGALVRGWGSLSFTPPAEGLGW